MTLATPVFLLTFLAVVVLMIRALFQAATKKKDRALRTLKILGVIVGAYAVIMIAVALPSQRTTIPFGQPKCFDEWCFSVDKVSRTPDSLVLNVEALNEGRRAQRPDTPRAFVIIDGKKQQIDCPRLTDRVEGHSANPFTIQIPVPPGTKTLDFLVTEGGGPTPIIVGDENTPFHAKSVWPLIAPTP